MQNLQGLQAEKARQVKKYHWNQRIVAELVAIGAILLFMLCAPAAYAGGTSKVSKEDGANYTQKRARQACHVIIHRAFQSCVFYKTAWVKSKCRIYSLVPRRGPFRFINIWFTECPLRFGVRNNKTWHVNWWGCTFEIERRKGRLRGGCKKDPQPLNLHAATLRQRVLATLSLKMRY